MVELTTSNGYRVVGSGREIIALGRVHEPLNDHLPLSFRSVDRASQAKPTEGQKGKTTEKISEIKKPAAERVGGWESGQTTDHQMVSTPGRWGMGASWTMEKPRAGRNRAGGIGLRQKRKENRDRGGEKKTGIRPWGIGCLGFHDHWPHVDDLIMEGAEKERQRDLVVGGRVGKIAEESNNPSRSSSSSSSSMGRI